MRQLPFAAVGLFIGCAIVAFLPPASQAAKPAETATLPGGYRQLVAEAKPALVWHFDAADPQLLEAIDSAVARPGEVIGKVTFRESGPQAPLFPLFDRENRAASFDGRGAYIQISDPGDQSPLDFTLGDTITIEAWVNLASIGQGQQLYVVGKGRTNNDGVARNNQNYALRLYGVSGSANLSFLFRSVAGDDKPSEFHRWNSATGFAAGSGWRHVAVSYEFGEPGSIRGWIDGVPTTGNWDYGGPTKRAPVVDNDDLWIGSSMGGNPGSSFRGEIDGLAIYRHALSNEQVASHFKIDPQALITHLPEPPQGTVLVEIIEGAAKASWELPPRAKPLKTFQQRQMAFVALPRKYNDSGVIADYAEPIMLRAFMKHELPAGNYEVLLRSFDGARLLIDGRPVVQTRFIRTGGGGHEAVPNLVESTDLNYYPAPLGHTEKTTQVQLAAGEHLFQLEALTGGKGNRPEIGDLCVCLKDTDSGKFFVLSPKRETSYPLTYSGWQTLKQEASGHVNQLNEQYRREAAKIDAEYWEHRHEAAREVVQAKPPITIPAANGSLPANNEIDRFLNAKLRQRNETPSEQTTDYQFVRRVSLDIRGVVPTPDEIDAFLADRQSGRRARLIDTFLADPRWADHWVPYWQDVLAENPGILKPMLNNTGPFRYWIRESFADNKPLDRMVTELLSMEGSKYYGGPAGFAMATQNDAPMAAKAHVAAQAFLGIEMKCARCHDAPYHPYLQSDLFELSAMLQGKSVKLPKTSTVPVSKGARQPLVEITLKAGAVLQPQWPFEELLTNESLPDGYLAKGSGPREQVAAIFTSPYNDRFAQVAVNRLWQRYMGIGIVDPVDDWHDAEPSHAELLDYLARELVLSGYDLKHVARLILNSHAYGRLPTADSNRALTPALRTFAAPARRRLTAEQIIDSAFVVAGKEFAAEELTLDPENRRPVSTFLSLGSPKHSWEFVSLSNERDRPALALPIAQTFVDALAMFGWRDSRQNPLTAREDSPTALQPLTFGNGVVGNRMVTLSDDSAFTKLALQQTSPEALIDALTLRLLARPATTAEKELFLPLIREGFVERITVDGGPPVVKRQARHTVSWSNHLSAEATRVKMELEEAAARGDIPTKRLEAPWRERLEDIIWALANSPEFMFVP